MPPYKNDIKFLFKRLLECHWEVETKETKEDIIYNHKIFIIFAQQQKLYDAIEWKY
jgi:hypothetical protein